MNSHKMQGSLSFLTPFVLVAVIVSAFFVVYIKDVNRRLFIDYQEQQQLAQKLRVEYNQLLLEQSTWSTQDRIQKLAGERLQMQIPSSNEIVVVK